MMKCAFVAGFGLIISAAALSQSPGWKTEHYDTMLVPPKAAHVTFLTNVGNGGTSDELTYTVEEPYPASDFVQDLCEEMRVRHWTPSGQGGCRNPQWMKIPTQSRDRYVQTLVWDKWDNTSNTWLNAAYELKYSEDKNEHYLRTLHVDTYASNRPPVAPQPTVINPDPSEAHQALIKFALIFGYVFVLVALFLLFGFTKLRSAVFYGGPSAWLTVINLLLFGPVVVSFLSLGEVLIAAVLPARENIPGSGALVAAVGLWMILAVCSVAGYVAIPIVLLPTGGILLSKQIPRNVKIAHAVIGTLTVSFFVVCLVFFSGPLIRW